MTVSFVFPEFRKLDKVRTSLTLDARGAKLTIVGPIPCDCGCLSQDVVVQSMMKGKGSEDPHRLSLVERMIRGSVPSSYPDAWAAAVELTTILTDEYVERNHKCKGAVPWPKS